jgi:thymidylate kinase
MIAFSGIDCSGKSTQIDLLCREFEKKNIKYEVIWSRGGYTPIIRFIKNLVRDKQSVTREERIAYSDSISNNSFKKGILFVASLIDLWFYYSVVFRIKELFGTTVVCDRYLWDTYIDYVIKYPGYTHNNGTWWHLMSKTIMKPKVSFIFTLSAEESMIRSTLKEEPFPETVDQRQKRIELYMDEIDNHRWQYVIDASVPINDVFMQVMARTNI